MLIMSAFRENLSIGQEMKCPLSVLTGVRIKQVEFRENVRAFFFQGHGKLSV